MTMRRTYSFCRSFRSLKRWGGSSVIILLDRSLLMTAKTQSNYSGNKGHNYYSTQLLYHMIKQKLWIQYNQPDNSLYNKATCISQITGKVLDNIETQNEINASFPLLTNTWYFAHLVPAWNFLLPIL